MEHEVQENYPRVCLSLSGMILSQEAKDFMLMNLDKYLPYACQHNDFVGLAFTLTTCICKQMLIARDFEHYSVSEFLTSFRIQSGLRTHFLILIFLKNKKPSCVMVEPQRRFLRRLSGIVYY